MQPELPPEIPDYQLLKCIGRGSYGTVWLARNIMGSYRAVKVVHRNAFADQKPFERELSGIRKFEPISRSYQGFIDVLHIGINEPLGYFYYVMELGDDEHSGQTIHPEDYSPKTLDKEMANRGRMSFQECLALGLELTKALAELHKHGLVHRDVKPANIIFVNGVPRLADIGLVAEAEAAPSFVGTAGFIPPEGPGKPQADIYSLGKVLYETSTGKDRQEFPNLPTQLESMPESGSFLELNEVLLQACQSDPQRRYQTAWAMHADLVVLANGKSVKRLRTLECRVANLKRVSVVFTVLFALLGVIFYQVYRERKAVREAHRRQDIVSGNAAVASGELYLALPFFADLLKMDANDPPNQKDARLQFASAFALGPKLNQIWFENREIVNGEFSPDGKKVLIAQELGDAKIYDAKTGAIYLHPLHQDYLMSAAYSRDGTMIVTTGEDGWVEIWNVATLEIKQRFRDPTRSFRARFSPDGRRLVTADGDGITRVWNLQNEKVELSLPGKEVIRFADFSPDGNLIVTCSQDHTAHIWNATNGSPVGPSLNQKSWIYYAAFSPDGKKLATASGDHKVKVWNTATGQLISPELFHDDAVMTVKFSPDGQLILTSCLDGTIRLWNADDYQPREPASIIRQGQRVLPREQLRRPFL